MAAAALGDLELLRAMGFSDNVSWLSVSRDGLYVASGQVTSMDFKIRIRSHYILSYSGTVRVWELDPVNRKIHPTECQTGHLRRLFTCVQMAKDNSYFYVGTTSGDILKVNTKQEDDG